MISDIKNPYPLNVSPYGAISTWTYLADIKNIANMYPYGKSYPAAATYSADDDYRYGFNGMEKEKSFDSDGDVADFGARFLDSEYPIFGSPDPKANILSSISPYSISMNNPVIFYDLNGEFPYTFHTKSFHPDKTFGGGFMGDNRSFSNDPGSSARISHYFKFDPSNGKTISKGFQDNFSAHPIGFLLAETNMIAAPSDWFIGKENPVEKQFIVEGSNSTYEIETGYEGSNPLTPSLVTPDIDVNSNFKINENIQAGVLTIDLNTTGDAFPSTESFIVDEAGNSVFIGVANYQGSALTSLFGDNSRPIFENTISINIYKEGIFQSINYQGSKLSLDEWNSKFSEEGKTNSNEED